MTATVDLSAREARRLAVAAAGLAWPATTARVRLAHVRAALEHLGVIQLDSVTAVARGHELTLFARLGAYDRSLVHALVADGHAVEAWAHEASLIPVEVRPLLGWRMRRPHAWGSMARLERDKPELLEAVLARVAEIGPVVAADLRETPARTGPWWGWDDTKQALEALFWRGRLVASRRPGSFVREYDLTERCLGIVPEEPDADTAMRALLVRAAGALGVATSADLLDYYRLPVGARPLIADLVDRGDLIAVQVEGWGGPAVMAPGTELPRRCAGRALISPFDPLIWNRPRTERIFGFHYRLEIYTPEAKRQYGYYVLPFLLGDRLVARVDLRVHRGSGTLRVLGAFAESGRHRHKPIAESLAAELRRMAGWLSLERIEISDRGDLSPLLLRYTEAPG
jgi:uncharacterized protein